MEGGRGKGFRSVQCRNFALSWKVYFVYLFFFIVTCGVGLSSPEPEVLLVTPFKRYVLTEEKFRLGSDNTTFQDACGNVDAEMAVISRNEEFEQVQIGFLANAVLKSERIYLFLSRRGPENNYRYYWAKEEVNGVNWRIGEPNKNCGDRECERFSMMRFSTEPPKLLDNCCSQNLRGLCFQDIDCDVGVYCADNGICTTTSMGNRCQCIPGYEQTWIDCEDENECLKPDLYPCRNNSYCENTVGNYTCSCEPGYIDINGTCQDVDECEDPNLYTCSDNRHCVNTDGYYTCHCDHGFTDLGNVCEDIDECENSTLYECRANSTCVNQQGHYTCVCHPGYTKDQYDECNDINECENTTLFDCQEHSACVNLEGNYTCDCDIGYLEQDNLCVDIDECENTTLFDCPEHSTCVNLDGSYTCDCNPGYLEQDNLCVDIDECKNSSLYDCPEHSMCVNTEGNYTCGCVRGYQEQGDLCFDVDECANWTLFKCPELSSCNNTGGGYTCICQDGYFTNERGLCEEVDKEGFKLRTCPCKCPKAVIELAKNLSKVMNNSEAIKEKSETISKKLEVKTANLTTAVRTKTSATDDRGSSASFGVIALTLLGLELLLITLGDIIVVGLYIKRKLANLCPTARGDGNMNDQRE